MISIIIIGDDYNSLISDILVKYSTTYTLSLQYNTYRMSSQIKLQYGCQCSVGQAMDNIFFRTWKAF